MWAFSLFGFFVACCAIAGVVFGEAVREALARLSFVLDRTSENDEMKSSDCEVEKRSRLMDDGFVNFEGLLVQFLRLSLLLLCFLFHQPFDELHR